MRLVLGVTTLDGALLRATGLAPEDDFGHEPVVVVGLRRWQELQHAERRARALEQEVVQLRATQVWGVDLVHPTAEMASITMGQRVRLNGTE